MDRLAVRRAAPALYALAILLALLVDGTGTVLLVVLIGGAVLMGLAYSLTAPRRAEPTPSHASERSAAREARRQRRD